ncbi:hypothetical protein DCC85_18975 [Paenibacillus sp. CAA11]|nr:hypothetical protein DCC85_18975 [Paenibacillus sp. CAA11]
MVISYSYTTQTLRTRAVDENKNLLFQGNRNISSLIQEINRFSLTVYSDSDFYRMIGAGYDNISANIQIYTQLNYIAKSMPDIFQVYLYSVKDNKATLVTQNTPKRWQSLKPFPDSVPAQDRSLSIQSTHPSHNYGLTAPNPQTTVKPVFTLHRRIEQVPSTRSLGYLSIDVKLSALSSIMDQLYDHLREKIYLLDSSGNMIYASAPELTGTRLQSSWYPSQLTAASAAQGFFEQDKSVFVYQRITDNADLNWTLVKEIPVSVLFHEAKESVRINLLLLALLLITMISVIVFISFRITAPIKQLARYMTQVQTGNLEIDIRPSGKDEVGFVTERFRSMMDTINNLILREYKLELTSRTHELRALQAQVNPHFLNNALQIIGTLALELKVPQIYSLLSALAKMMRYSMRNDEKVVTLRDELEHVKAYIELQKERFENKFSFRYDAEEAVMDAKLPKMVLQPIVENYFKHGFRLADPGSWIEIKARKQSAQRIEIVIQNNGRSISAESLARLQRELERPDGLQVSELHEENRLEVNPGSGIGLSNVLARLRLICGDDASLTVIPISPNGVSVRLEFEIQTEREANEDLNCG